MSDISKLPKFSDLPKVGQTEERHTWGVLGPDNQLGSVNLLTPAGQASRDACSYWDGI